MKCKVICHYLAPRCTGDLVFSKCHSACPLRCNKLKLGSCIKMCIPGCECPSGLYKDGDRCYKKNDCPRYHGNLSKVANVAYAAKSNYT